MSLHLYHHNSSVCAAKVRIALAEKGLAWDGTLKTLQGDQFRFRLPAAQSERGGADAGP